MAFYQNLKYSSVSVPTPQGALMSSLLQYDYFESDDLFYDRFCGAAGLTRFDSKEDLVQKPTHLDHTLPYRVREEELKLLSRTRLLVIARKLGVEVADKEPSEEIIQRILRRW